MQPGGGRSTMKQSQPNKPHKLARLRIYLKMPAATVVLSEGHAFRLIYPQNVSALFQSVGKGVNVVVVNLSHFRVVVVSLPLTNQVPR
jgi:hypothetical protein